MKWYKKFDSFMTTQKFTKSEYDHCVYFKRLENGMFIILVLFVHDMFIARKSMVDINQLKDWLARMFNMKDLGASKLIFGIEIDIAIKMVSFGCQKRSM